MNFIIIASDIHTGGGKVLLDDLLSAAKELIYINFKVLIDARFNSESYNSENISFIEIAKLQRIFYVNKIISNLVSQQDIILNLSGLPFLRSFPCTKVQYIQNRFYIDNYSTSGLPFIVRLRLILQKFSFTIFLKYSDYIFVQNLAMKALLLKSGFNERNISVIPFVNIEKIDSNGKVPKDSFIYVASGEAHKNHLNLVKAWAIMAEDNIYPTLVLTIEKESPLYNQILFEIQKYNLKIIFQPRLNRDEMILFYGKFSALIYPSFFESFGLPLLEASRQNLPIIASELDYVRDSVDPVETFDPNSPKSISRAVRRFLSNDEKVINVLSAKEFFKEMLIHTNKKFR
jgi:glycosyltransferase involved in cell wall biosynthesis